MSENNVAQRSDGAIIPPELAVRAMRDSGYRNTASALAELIDNSIQAKARNVDVICTEKQELVNERKRRRINAIGVMDNGDGMSPKVLRLALQFGNGTHLDDRAGIGRFGMGLPNSSISQCRKVEVWTWQNGPDNAVYTYLDVDEIESGHLSFVPVPVDNPLPDEWRTRSNIVDTTGTFVLWTKFDEHRLSWRGAVATLRNTEVLVGRMYRKFIDDGRTAVRLVALIDEEPKFKKYAQVNDPLYLMRNSLTPEPFNEEPMFQTWGEGDDEIFEIDYYGAKHKVLVKMSWARPKTIPEDRSDRGAKKYGKHAAKNIGVSIVREGRELDLDTGWTNSYDPTERWWGVEVEFPSTLDEVFGVTNNKQSATTFSQMAQFDWKSAADDGELEREFRERIQGEGDPRSLLWPIVDHIKRQIFEIHKRLDKQTYGLRRNNDRHDKPSSEDRATTKYKERAEQGHVTVADKEEFTEENKRELEKDLIDEKNYPENVAKEIANATLDRKRKVIFVTKLEDGYAFFNVEHKQGGVTEIVFNRNHPFYEKLIETLDPKLGEETDVGLIDRVYRAADTLKLLFAAWARYEMEEVHIHKQNKLFDMRQEWGKMARFFLEESDN